MSDTPSKRVDESWKQEVDKEREKLRETWGGLRRPAGEPRPSRSASTAGGASASDEPKDAVPEEHGEAGEPGEEHSAFVQFLLGLRMQALMALGEIPHPVTQQPEIQPDQAQYIIETLALLQEKTSGNLTRYEAAVFDQMLYELRMRYVQLMQPPPAKAG